MDYTAPLLSIVFILGLMGAVRLPACKGKKLVLAALAGLVLVSWPPFDWLFSRPLEIWYPIRPAPISPADAIVVLSAAVEPPIYERPYALAGHDTYGRCRMAAWLYQHWKALPILACGGGSKAGGPSFAASMREVLVKEGVPDADIWTEERSQTTHQNAVFGAEILRSHGVKRIALVVEAQSMVRAAACFRKEGFVVVPAPSDFREWSPWRDELLLSWQGVRRNEITLHEVVGLLWYKLHGWI